MKKKIFKKVIIIIVVLIVLYWFPFRVISLSGRSSIVSSVNQLPNSDAVIIFGTLVNESGDITPLLKERLDAGKAILEEGRVKKIVVSNTEVAANVMAEYLFTQGINENLVEIDIQADKTPDTCTYEKENYPENRKLIFVSQGFHLPRLLYQCNQLSVQGTAFPAEALSTIDRSECSFLTKIRVRTTRYAREAGLTWLAFLNIYQ
ncbi:MAG: YdcF family protein [Candidatus Peregrinibacteria bacterium]|nr:YdcF family protein [Candidatus Peregrinibacteria bacterium]